MPRYEIKAFIAIEARNEDQARRMAQIILDGGWALPGFHGYQTDTIDNLDLEIV